MQLFSYNLHSLLYLSSQLVYLLSIVYLCFILLPSSFIVVIACLLAFLTCFIALMMRAQPSWARICLNIVFFYQIHVPRCFLPCLCLDLYLHVYVLLSMLMLRSIFLCALFHVDVSRSTYWLLCYVLLKSFVSFCTFFLFFGPLGRVQIQILRSRPTSMHLGLYQRVWIISFMYVYACLLLCFISMLTCPDLGFAMLFVLYRLVFVGLWGHLLMWLHPPNRS